MLFRGFLCCCMIHGVAYVTVVCIAIQYHRKLVRHISSQPAPTELPLDHPFNQLQFTKKNVSRHQRMLQSYSKTMNSQRNLDDGTSGTRASNLLKNSSSKQLLQEEQVKVKEEMEGAIGGHQAAALPPPFVVTETNMNIGRNTAMPSLPIEPCPLKVTFSPAADSVMTIPMRKMPRIRPVEPVISSRPVLSPQVAKVKIALTALKKMKPSAVRIKPAVPGSTKDKVTGGISHPSSTSSTCVLEEESSMTTTPAPSNSHRLVKTSSAVVNKIKKTNLPPFNKRQNQHQPHGLKSVSQLFALVHKNPKKVKGYVPGATGRKGASAMDAVVKKVDQLSGKMSHTNNSLDLVEQTLPTQPSGQSVSPVNTAGPDAFPEVPVPVDPHVEHQMALLQKRQHTNIVHIDSEDSDGLFDDLSISD